MGSVSTYKTKWIVPGAAVLCCVAWFFLWFNRTRAQNASLGKRRVLLQADASKVIPDIRIRGVQLLADSLAAALEARTKRIFPETNFPDLGKQMEQAISPFGLAVLSIRPDYESLKTLRESGEPMCDLPMQWVLRGSFMQLAKFLDGIETLPFAIKVQEIRLSKQAAKSVTLDMELNGVVVLGKTIPAVSAPNETKPSAPKPNPANAGLAE